MDYMKNIGSNIRYERRQRGLTIDDFARIIDMAPGFMGLIERGQRGTTIPNLVKICNFFDITLDELITKDLSKGSVKIKEVDTVKSSKNRRFLQGAVATMPESYVNILADLYKSINKNLQNESENE